MNAAEHAAIGAWRMKSGGGHCCRTLVEEAGGWGPTVHTAIRTWRRGLARSLARRIGETCGEEDWQDILRIGWSRHLAQRIGEEEKKNDEKKKNKKKKREEQL